MEHTCTDCSGTVNAELCTVGYEKGIKNNWIILSENYFAAAPDDI